MSNIILLPLFKIVKTVSGRTVGRLHKRRWRGTRPGRWRETGPGGSMRDGQEIAKQTHERNPDQTGGVRVHQDNCLCGRGHLKGATMSADTVILKWNYVFAFPQEPVEEWPIVDCLISFHSKGFPLDKAISYANLRNPFIINNLPMQYDIQVTFSVFARFFQIHEANSMLCPQDRRKVYSILGGEGIEIPRYAVLDRDSPDPKCELTLTMHVL